MCFQVVGLGTAVPSELVMQEDAACQSARLCSGDAQHTATVATLYRRSGVRKRHSVLLTSSTSHTPARQSFYRAARSSSDRGPTTAERMQQYNDHAVALAQQSSAAALESAGWSAEQISHLVTVSCTGFGAPGVDIGLIDGLGLRRDASRTHIGFMGCHGALNGLRVARALAASQPGAKVLLCCVELCSLHHQYSSDVQQIVSNALFSDGSAALAGTTTAADGCPWRLTDQRSCVLRNSTDLMGWRIGNHGFQMMLSRRVPEVIQSNLLPWLVAWLADNSLQISDIRGWAIHPGGPRILTACSDALGLDVVDVAVSQQMLREFGNMSSPTVLFILDELRRSGDRLPCVALAFGPGLAIEAALFR